MDSVGGDVQGSFHLVPASSQNVSRTHVSLPVLPVSDITATFSSSTAPTTQHINTITTNDNNMMHEQDEDLLSGAKIGNEVKVKLEPSQEQSNNGFGAGHQQPQAQQQQANGNQGMSLDFMLGNAFSQPQQVAYTNTTVMVTTGNVLQSTAFQKLETNADGTVTTSVTVDNDMQDLLSSPQAAAQLLAGVATRADASVANPGSEMESGNISIAVPPPPYSTAVASIPAASKKRRPNANLSPKGAVNRMETLKKNICAFCSKCFQNPSHLTRHVRIHTGEKPYPCQLCTRAFSRKDKLDGHMRTHTGEKPYECVACQQRFLHLSAYKYHQAKHQQAGENVPLPLPRRRKKKATEKMATSATDTRTEEESAAKASDEKAATTVEVASFLPDTFNYLSQAMSNVLSTAQSEVLSPADQGTPASAVGNSVAFVSPKVEEQDEQPQQSFVYAATAALPNENQQIDYNSSQSEQLSDSFGNSSTVPGISAPQVQQISATSSTGRKAKRNRHSNQKSGGGIKRSLATSRPKSNSIVHTPSGPVNTTNMTRTQLRRLNAICHICQKDFASNSHVKRHMVVHTGEKPYVCRICLKAFNRKDKLQLHIKTHNRDPNQPPTPRRRKSKHGGANNDSTPTSSKLVDSTESGEKKANGTGKKGRLGRGLGKASHKCQICGKQFGRTDALMAHVDLHHAECPNLPSDAFRCMICTRQFLEMEALHQHLNVHTEQTENNLHRCRNCDTKYADELTLNRHMECHVDKLVAGQSTVTGGTPTQQFTKKVLSEGILKSRKSAGSRKLKREQGVVAAAIGPAAVDSHSAIAGVASAGSMVPGTGETLAPSASSEAATGAVVDNVAGGTPPTAEQLVQEFDDLISEYVGNASGGTNHGYSTCSAQMNMGSSAAPGDSLTQDDDKAKIKQEIIANAVMLRDNPQVSSK